MSAAALQTLLRFLTQDAKIPLATALKGVPALQKANLDTISAIAESAALKILSVVFPEEKQAKQIHSAAKRVNKKRDSSNDDTASSPASKKQKKTAGASRYDAESGETGEEDLESSLALPKSGISEEDLATKVLITNRAPLVLAFVLTLLKHTLPSQPLSSRLSLAQGYVGLTSRARAISLGIEKGVTAEEEGVGEGQPVVKMLGKEIRVLRRWGYEWKKEDDSTALETEQKEEEGESGTDATALEDQTHQEPTEGNQGEDVPEEADEPPLWALDLEALKKSNSANDPIVQYQSSSKSSAQHTQSHLPIYTPQSARAYLLKAFATPSPSSDSSSTSPTTATSSTSKSAKAQKAEKETNLAMLLQSLDLLYESWSKTLSPDEMDKRTWGWYVRVRPDVLPGAAGWGGRGEVRLADILNLRRVADSDG